MHQLLGISLASLSLFALSSTVWADPEAGTVEEVAYKTVDQGDLKMQIHLPKDWKPADRRPAILFFFGGGWRVGSTSQFKTQAEYFASRGLVTARADYRVQTRHGTSASEAVEDAFSALRWLQEHADQYGIDPSKIIASGGSAGGHLAACTGMAPESAPTANPAPAPAPARPCALILFNPVLAIDDPRILRAARVSEEVGLQISPTLHVDAQTPPTLLLYGTDDPLEAQAQPYLDAAKKAGVRAELYTARDVSHGFFNREPWKTRTIIRADEFLESLGYLHGPPTIQEKASTTNPTNGSSASGS